MGGRGGRGGRGEKPEPVSQAANSRTSPRKNDDGGTTEKRRRAFGGGGEEKVVREREEEEEEVWKSTRSTFHGRLIEQMGRTNVMCTVPPLLTQPPPH